MSITKQMLQMDSKFKLHIKHIEEIEVFIRKITQHNYEFDKLQRQVYELIEDRNAKEIRRKNDMKKFESMIQEVKDIMDNESTNFKIGFNRLELRLNDYKDIVERVIKKNEVVNVKVAEMERNVVDAKEHYFNVVRLTIFLEKKTNTTFILKLCDVTCYSSYTGRGANIMIVMGQY